MINFFFNLAARASSTHDGLVHFNSRVKRVEPKRPGIKRANYLVIRLAHELGRELQLILIALPKPKNGNPYPFVLNLVWTMGVTASNPSLASTGQTKGKFHGGIGQFCYITTYT